MSTVIYLENNPVLRKNLCAKDEIIKNLVETQSTALNTISAKSNIQHLNSLNQANFSLPSKNLNQHCHNTKQLVSQEQQFHLFHYRVLCNWKKYCIPFKHTTKDLSETLLQKVNIWAIYWKILPNKIFVNFLV